MANTPQFAATPVMGVATISAANTNRDGTGTITNVLTAGASGTRIRRIEVQATGNTTAGMVRLFLHDGANTHLFMEAPVLPATPGQTAAAFSVSYAEDINPELLPLMLPSGWSLRASTHNAESFKVIAEGGNL